MKTLLDDYKRIVVDGKRYYGRHLIVDAADCNDDLLDKERIRFFLSELVERIDMVAFGAPIVERFGSGIEEGISAVQLIETSAIVIHTNDRARDLYLDVFSCKDFYADDVLDFVDECFQPGQMKHKAMLRQ